jgi:glycosyltransferase involved in cell wall biosynthesis/PAS domain-containing protein
MQFERPYAMWKQRLANHRRRYLLPVAASVAVLAAVDLVRPTFSIETLLLGFLFAVLVSSRFGGFLPGLLAIFIGMAASLAELAVAPGPTRGIDHASVVAVAVFAIAALTISAVNEFRRASKIDLIQMSDDAAQILSAAPACILVLSLDGRIVHANSAVRGILGVPPSHLIGRKFDDLGLSVLGQVGDSYSASVIPIEWISSKAESVRGVEACTAGPVAVRRCLNVDASPMKDTGGNVAAIVVCLTELHCGTACDSDADSHSEAYSALELDRSVESRAAGVARDTPVRAINVLYLDHTSKLSGGEIALVRALSTMDRERVVAHVLLAEEGPLVDRLRAIGIETTVLPLSDRLRNVRKDSLGLGVLARIDAPFRLIGYTLAVARYAKRHKIDIIHTNSLKSDIYGGLAGLVARVPVVWHVRDYIDPSYLPRPTVAAFRALARIMPAHVITNSESTCSTLMLGGRRPSHVIPSGFDFGAEESPASDPRRRRPEFSEERCPVQRDRISTIGIVGRLAAWKGQHIFLEAAAKVFGAGHSARFVIVGAALFGEEDYEKQLYRQVEELGISEHVEFLGFRSDVQSILRSIDILVHASISPEPFGQVVVEGLAEGLPVIGSNSGGVPEIITHRLNGLLVPMGDAAALADAIAELLDCPTLSDRLGQAGYWHVRQNFKAATTAARIVTVYDAVLAGAKRRRRT